MVSISNVTAAKAKHYYETKDNYYTKEAGQYQGKGAAVLGLSGAVKSEDFQKLLAGQGTTGEELVTGSKANNGKHRAAVDITFSAGKSISVLSEIVGDERVRDAHDRAVTAALDYVEANYAQCRQTVAGETERVNTGNMVIAKFQHDTSRELDPQLHTHAVVMNMTQRTDGSWRALSNEELYQQKMLIGQVYRSELAANLKELGYNIESESKGLFEVSGVDKELCDHFSQRSEQIDNKVRELKESEKYVGIDDSKLREIATLGSRVAKKKVDPNIVRESWTERLKEQGHTVESVIEATRKAAEQSRAVESERLHNEPKSNEYDVVRQAAKIITESESTFNKEDVLKVAGRLSMGEQRIGDLDRAFDELAKDKEIVRLGASRDRQGGKTEHYTTIEMQKTERENIKFVNNGQGKAGPIMTPEKAQEGIKAYEQDKNMILTPGQKAAAEHVLTSNDRVLGVQGDAGTGKTTTLDAVRVEAEKQGYEVRGFAHTGKAASEIEAASGIKSQTIDSFLNEQRSTFIANEKRHDSAPSLSDKQLWIIDEASTLGSKKMNEIFERAEEADAKVVLIGDAKQLQSIDAGRAFRDLQENGMQTVRMTEVQRQKDEHYKSAVEDLANKKVDKAIDKLEAKGRFHEISDRDQRLEAIKNEYSSRTNHKDIIIVTSRNDDRNQLNSQIRDELKEKGKLKGEDHVFVVRESKNLSPESKHFAQSYQVGDIVTANHGMGRNGNEARVIAVDQKTHTLTTRDKDSHAYTVDLKRDGGELSVYREKEERFSKGDKVVMLKNDRTLEVKNGHVGEIQNLEKNGRVSFKMEDGRQVNINIRDQYNYVDHGYAVTAYKSQGQTSQKVIYHADTEKGVNYNEAYVAITRGKQNVEVYTDSKEQFREQVKVEQVKTSTIEHEKSQAKTQNRDAGDWQTGGQDSAGKGKGEESGNAKASSQENSKTEDRGGIER